MLDLVASGRRAAQVAADLDIGEQAIYTWHRQELVDTGQLPGKTNADNTELVTVHHRAAELLKGDSTPKDGMRRSRRSPRKGGRVQPACRVLGVVLTQVLGLSYAEAADITGCPIGTIR